MAKHKVYRPVAIGRQHGQIDKFEEVEINADLYDLYNPMEKTPRAIYDGIANDKPILVEPRQTVSGIELADSVVEMIRKQAIAVGVENELVITKHTVRTGELGDPVRGKRAA